MLWVGLCGGLNIYNGPGKGGARGMYSPSSKQRALESDRPGSEYGLCHLLAVYGLSGFSFLICK